MLMPSNATSAEKWVINIPSGMRPSRRMIVIEYFRLRSSRQYQSSIPKRIAENLGYNLDVNGSNSFVLRVLRDYFGNIRQQDHCVQTKGGSVPLNDTFCKGK
jgi:hypothetical protein